MKWLDFRAWGRKPDSEGGGSARTLKHALLGLQLQPGHPESLVEEPK